MYVFMKIPTLNIWNFRDAPHPHHLWIARHWYIYICVCTIIWIKQGTTFLFLFINLFIIIIISAIARVGSNGWAASLWKTFQFFFQFRLHSWFQSRRWQKKITEEWKKKLSMDHVGRQAGMSSPSRPPRPLAASFYIFYLY